MVERYPNVEEVVWAQEEPKNMGAWSYVSPRLRGAIGNAMTIRYIGRPERASPAEGYAAPHAEQQAQLVRRRWRPLANKRSRRVQPPVRVERSSRMTHAMLISRSDSSP